MSRIWIAKTLTAAALVVFCITLVACEGGNANPESAPVRDASTTTPIQAPGSGDEGALGSSSGDEAPPARPSPGGGN